MKKVQKILLEIWRCIGGHEEERHHFIGDTYLYGLNAKVISLKAQRAIRKIVEADIKK